jgi:hypothetical protein
MFTILGFIFRCLVAIVISAFLVRWMPSLAHQVWATGQVGISWLLVITVFLVWLTYKVWKA